MNQIIHIFRKDMRRHWREIALSLAILAAFAWNDSRRWEPRRFDENPWLPFLSQWLGVMVLIGWFLLIVRVIHDEVLVGDRQFWVTRPYEWKKLLGAKVFLSRALPQSSAVHCSNGIACESRLQADRVSDWSAICSALVDTDSHFAVDRAGYYHFESGAGSVGLAWDIARA